MKSFVDNTSMGRHKYLELLTASGFHIIAAQSSTCIQPSVSSSYYSSTDEKLTRETAFVVEFTLSCQNKIEVGFTSFLQIS